MLGPWRQVIRKRQKKCKKQGILQAITFSTQLENSKNITIEGPLSYTRFPKEQFTSVPGQNQLIKEIKMTDYVHLQNVKKTSETIF